MRKVKIMPRKTKVAVRLARDFVRNPRFYFDYPPTVAEVSRRLYVSNQALKKFLLGNPIPGLSIELCLVEHRGRWLPAYRIFVQDLERAVAFQKEFLNV